MTSAYQLYRFGFKECSPLLGFNLVKAGMVLSYYINPMVYTCQFVALYCLTLIRRESKGNILFVYLALYVCMDQYFYQSKHIAKFTVVNTEWICDWKCPKSVGLPLQYFELHIAHIFTILMAPFVINSGQTTIVK
jgi:hypothetical protein